MVITEITFKLKKPYISSLLRQKRTKRDDNTPQETKDC